MLVLTALFAVGLILLLLVGAESSVWSYVQLAALYVGAMMYLAGRRDDVSTPDETTEEE